jgi:beta-lactamase class A
MVLLVAGGIFWYRDHSVSSPTTDNNQSQAEAPAEPTGPDAQLEALLTGWAQAHPEHQWAMVVRGLDGDKRYASYRAGEVYEAASIYKLFLTYLLFKEISLDQVGSITVSSQGRSWSLEHCLDVALRVSDNPCAWAIGNYTGWESSNPELSQAGFSNTTLDITAGHRTSAEDTANLLDGMYKATLYTAEERDYLLNTLRKQSYNQGIPAGCSGCTVANKTGELPGIKHDAAIVQYNGKAYLVVIFSDGATYTQIAELAGQIHGYISK